MPIKIDNIPERSIRTAVVDEKITMDKFFFYSQDSLGLLDPSELGEIEPHLIEEMMTSVNNEAEFMENNNNNIDDVQIILYDSKPYPDENNVSPPTGNIPSQEDFTGPYGFDLHLTSSSQNRGGYAYSQPLHQVFIRMNNILLMEFKTTIQPEPGFYIRALLMYTCDDFVCVPVVRCFSHALDEDSRQEAHAKGEEAICRCADFNYVGHVMRCTLSDAEYCYDSLSERHSVKVPVKKLQAGTDVFQVPYSFSCKSSCPRGIQRKPIQIVFTLEKEDKVYGRKVLPVKICSCPKRDKDRQEKESRKAQQPVVNCPSSSKRLATPLPPNQTENQPPIKNIKLEDRNSQVEDSQNEDDKQRHRKLINHNNQEHEYYQRYLARIESKIENRLDRIETAQKETNERLDRIESLFQGLYNCIQF